MMENLKALELKQKIIKYMKGISRMIYMKEKELENIQMEIDMKGNFMKVFLKEKEFGIILMEVDWKVFG